MHKDRGESDAVITNKAFWVMKQLWNNSETIPASTAEHFWVMNILCCLVFRHNQINSVELTVCLFLEPNSNWKIWVGYISNRVPDIYDKKMQKNVVMPKVTSGELPSYNILWFWR